MSFRNSLSWNSWERQGFPQDKEVLLTASLILNLGKKRRSRTPRQRSSRRLMKIRSFEFNLRELAGSMGDFGTLFPLAIGYIAVCGLNPAGLFVMMGLANIATGLLYRLPMPIEPMKLLAVVAIAQSWTPSMVYASGFAMGVIWVLIGVTGIMARIGKITPNSGWNDSPPSDPVYLQEERLLYL